MRCKICDIKLSVSEVKRKDVNNTYIDIYGTCLGVTYTSLSEYGYGRNTGFDEILIDDEDDFS